MNTAYNGKVFAPWDDDTVDVLNEYQCMGIGHPYTCPRDHPNVEYVDRYTEMVLDATEAGWICPAEGCGYTQRWAHASDADRSHLRLMKRQLEEIAQWAG